MKLRLIGKVKITKMEPRPGESFLVEVFDENEISYKNQFDTSVYINGNPGAAQYLQFATEGPRKIYIKVVKNDKHETYLTEVKVSGRPLQFQLGQHSNLQRIDALLNVKQTFQNPYEANFQIGIRQVKKKKKNQSKHDLQKDIREKSVFENKKMMNYANTDVINSDKNSLDPMDSKKQKPTFEWDFGDGNKVITSSTRVTHDYTNSLTPDNIILNFDVSCRALLDNIKVTRTLIVHSAYALSRKNGFILPLAKGDIEVIKYDPSSFFCKIQVLNIENSSLKLTHQSISAITNNPDDIEKPSFTELNQPIILPPSSTTALGMYPNTTQIVNFVPGHTSGISVIFAGEHNGQSIRVSHVFDLPNFDSQNSAEYDPPALEQESWPWEEVTESINRIVDRYEYSERLHVNIYKKNGIISISTKKQYWNKENTKIRLISKEIASMGIITFEKFSSTHKFSSLKNTNRITDTSLESKSSLLKSTRTLEQEDIVEGQICDPDNISESERKKAKKQYLECQGTDVESTKKIPGRFLNARKGDIILDPSGTGLVGELLRQLTPSQFYSHSGIMTKNYEEITHSFASIERLENYKKPGSIFDGEFVDGTDGLRHDVLKWMWPGVVIQSVEAAVNGEEWEDPELPGSYTISAFKPYTLGFTHNDDFRIIEPLVVKPDPMKETDKIRKKLHNVADSAKADGGTKDGKRKTKSHYRLHCMVDPKIGLEDRAPTHSKWAEGTYPSVCSSFIWMILKKNNIHLEGSIENSDIQKGAEVTSFIDDGLYLYRGEEFLEAGEWLYSKINHMVYNNKDLYGCIGEFFTDLPDDVANQFLNTFAFDDPGEKDYEKWRGRGDSTAVSPENILFWDGPDKGGLYGYFEHLHYREPREEVYEIYRWKKVQANIVGKISGKVTLENQLVVGAEVCINDRIDHTDSNGFYEISDLYYGQYTIKAYKSINNIYYSNSQKIYLDEEKLELDIALNSPDEKYRKVKLYVNFSGIDDELFSDDDTYDPDQEYYERELGPDRIYNFIELEYKWGNEIRVEYRITFHYNPDDLSILTIILGWLYEGGSESTNDQDDFKIKNFILKKGEENTDSLALLNKGWFGGDSATLAFRVFNDINDN